MSSEAAPEENPSTKTENQPPFGAEYAKSGRAKCKGCKETITKDSLRMSVRTPSSFFDGLQDNWFHYECFWKRIKSENLSEGNIRGMESLKWDDQENIRQRIVELKKNATEVPTPKSHVPKVEIAKSSAGKCFQCKEKISKGELRIQLKGSNFHPQCLKSLEIITNGVESIQGYEFLEDDQKKILDGIFGKAAEKRKAPEDEVPATPAKKAKIEPEIDEELKAKLKKQSEVLWQVRKDIAENVSQDEIVTILRANGRFRRKRDGPSGTIEQLVDCIIFGVPETCNECDNGVFFYSTSQHSYKCSGHISQFTFCANSNRIPSRNALNIPKAVKKSNEFLKNHIFPALDQRYYAPGTDKVDSPLSENPIDKIKRKRHGTEDEMKSNKQAIVKNGCSVDGNCEVAEIAHVYISDKKTVYQATLGNTSIAENRNSYYKLQLLKHDKKNEYYLFRSWGRIGTNQGGYKTDFYEDDLKGARKEFKRLFLEKSKNEWKNRRSFEKKPGLMNILEMELNGQDVKKSHAFNAKESKSKLPMPIKELISTIFDVDTITETLKALEIDLEKMPLGKMSKNNIMKAMCILKKLEEFVAEGAREIEILDFSNRFYALIPHACGSEAPPKLNNDKLIHDKTNLLNDLLEIEIAYSIIKSNDEAADDKIDPIDTHYEKLHCEIVPLSRDSNEFEIVEAYAKKTHAPTHDCYTLEIVDVFKVSRDGEDARFKKDIGNRNLLWHGSRTSNFAGILSQGLRIAPPEAPVNGYMFGKGIYFADMVSKSANYCGVNISDGEGFLLLCEVALGEIQEEKNAKEHITKPKKQKSSVKGLGQIVPDESDRRVIEDGIIVPIGKPMKSKSGKKQLDLLYNEYIVYDEAQVKMRYLIRTKFSMK